MTKSEFKMNRASMGILDWMFILFLGLKLTDQIDWSWWWVTAPLWAGYLVVFVLAVIAVAVKK